MKIEKLPSGSYRIRKMYKGKMYTVIFDYKPTQKEAMQAMAEELDKVSSTKGERLTFEKAARQYIEAKSNVLSPTTRSAYGSILRSLSPDFIQKNIHDITSLDVQTEINIYSVGRTPKTVHNVHGFISAVLGTFCPNLKLSTTLPKKVKNKPYIPSDEDIRKILQYAKGSRYEVALMLACFGLRRSEICALTLDDIKGDVVTINKAKVYDKEKKQWVIKPTPKTTSSTREIVIPKELVALIEKQGYIYKGHPDNIYDFLDVAQKNLGMEHFSIHKLRHYFASKMSALGIPETDIMAMGGWETPYVMRAVYTHSMEAEQEKAKRKAAEQLKESILS